MTVADALAAAVGPQHVLTDVAVLGAYGTDWTRRWSCPPAVVVRPGSTAEVSAVLAVCFEQQVPVVPQGGNTGLVGGSVPGQDGWVLLSTVRLDQLGPVDSATGQVTAGAGVSVAALQRHAADSGWTYGVDLASRDSATVGGTLATNAGGVRVVVHGDTRSQVLGCEAVLADGSVVSHLAGLPKDSAGYDLSGLLVGSEGTLAVLTAARLRLVRPLPADRATVLVGVGSVARAQELSRRPDVLAAELLTGPAMDLVCDALGLSFPLAARWPAYLLLETALLPDLPNDADAVSDRRLWEYRERLTEAVATLGVVHKLDVAVPAVRLPELVDRLPEAWAPFDGYVFGHLAEANVHVEVVGADPADEDVDERVLRLVAGLGGTVSAEHGVGRAKARWLGLTRSSEEIQAMRQIKQALDPRGLLNPGVLLG